MENNIKYSAFRYMYMYMIFTFLSTSNIKIDNTGQGTRFVFPHIPINDQLLVIFNKSEMK